jgi:hypothetical protein
MLTPEEDEQHLDIYQQDHTLVVLSADEAIQAIQNTLRLVVDTEAQKKKCRNKKKKIADSDDQGDGHVSRC